MTSFQGRVVSLAVPKVLPLRNTVRGQSFDLDPKVGVKQRTGFKRTA